MKPAKMPWTGEYRVFGIPNSFKPYPDKPVFDILDTVAKKFKRNGLIQNNYKLTYPKVRDHAIRLASAFYKFGFKKGDRIVTLLPTSIQFVVVDYAISKAGLVHVPCSSLEPETALLHKIDESKPKMIICLDAQINLAHNLAVKSDVKHILLTNIDDYSDAPPQKKGDLGHPNWYWLTSLIENTPPQPPEYNFNVEEDLETLLFTGGTTGLPKGCMLTHRNIYANAIQNLWVMGQTGIAMRGALSVLLGLPFFHSFGHIIMHSMMLHGWNLLLVTDPRDTDTMVRMIKKYRPLLQIGVPTQFMKFSAEELKGTGMLNISGSAPLPSNTQKEYEKKSGGGIMEGYGLSEMSPTTHLNSTFLLRLLGGRVPVSISNFLLRIPGVKFVVNRIVRMAGPKLMGYSITRAFILLGKLTSPKENKKKKKSSHEKRGTIGVPFPDTEIKIIDAESGKELTFQDMKNGKVGEMLLKGPQRMLGYWPNPGDGIDEDGYIHTSDVIKIDERGYFYIVDRTKDMVNVSGYKVYSREIDDILFDHEAVEMAGTIGIPDPNREGSERVVVYIQPKAQFKNKLREEDIISYLKERVAKYAIPRKVIFVDELPLTEVQKVNKKYLRKLALETA